jgi:hypothetical protein
MALQLNPVSTTRKDRLRPETGAMADTTYHSDPLRCRLKASGIELIALH